jgi:ankyrin repeat protein
MTTTQAVLEAITANDPARARQLIEQAPDAARGLGANGESPLLAAIYRGQAELAALIAAQREITLPEAAAIGDAARAKAILQRDPESVRVRSSDGWTSLHLAAFMGHPEVVKLLLENGAELEAVSQNGIANRALHAAIAGKESAEVVELLLARGADVTAKAEAEATPLHLAAARGNMTLTRRLLDMKADPRARMTDGKTPADFASERGHPEVANLLNGITRGG